MAASPAKTASTAKVRVEITPVRVIAAMLSLAILCGAAFAVVQALRTSIPLGLTPVEATPAGEVVARETFETLDAWLFKAGAGANYSFALQSGEMQAEVSGTALHNYYVGGEFDAASVEVDAKWIDGNEDRNGRFGLVLRRKDKSAYYFEYFPFQDGLWSVQLGANDTFEMLGKGNVPRDRQRPPKEVTRMRADLTVNRARLFVNDVLLGEFDVSRVATGQIGVSVTADPGRRSRVAFDNFVIRRP